MKLVFRIIDIGALLTTIQETGLHPLPVTQRLVKIGLSKEQVEELGFGPEDDVMCWIED